MKYLLLLSTLFLASCGLTQDAPKTVIPGADQAGIVTDSPANIGTSGETSTTSTPVHTPPQP